MKFVINAFFVVSAAIWFSSCKNAAAPVQPGQHATFNALLKNYYEQSLKLFPLSATQYGDNRYNDLLPNNITVAFRNQERQFYQSYLDSLNSYDRSKLEYNDQVSYDVLKWETQINLDGLKFHDELMPINQFWSLTLTMGQLGSGSFTQPFKTVKDYDNFLSRISAFTVWCDTAIANMRRGVTLGYVLPKSLVVKMIPQAKE